MTRVAEAPPHRRPPTMRVYPVVASEGEGPIILLTDQAEAARAAKERHGGDVADMFPRHVDVAGDHDKVYVVGVFGDYCCVGIKGIFASEREAKRLAAVPPTKQEMMRPPYDKEVVERPVFRTYAAYSEWERKENEAEQARREALFAQRQAGQA
ncbi:hypothetical protein DFJ74DRAFT_670660 [Hyaloraphidium curvatum]|nr:hypothetical protein DFJ74DRAFT_670660 [Hyaloraphidium curvatum]